MEKTTIEIELPADDRELIADFLGLPGAKKEESESHFGGAEWVGITIEVLAAVNTAAVAIKAVADAGKSVRDMAESLRSLFRRGIGKYRNNPNGHFVVVVQGEPFLTDDMPESEIEQNLAKLVLLDDRQRR